MNNNIKWKKHNEMHRPSANVNLFMAPLKDTNKVGGSKTDHRIMMEKLGLWNKFEQFKSRVCTEEGKRHVDFRVELETELFYGFTRKGNHTRKRRKTRHSKRKGVRTVVASVYLY